MKFRIQKIKWSIASETARAGDESICDPGPKVNTHSPPFKNRIFETEDQIFVKYAGGSYRRSKKSPKMLI
jgi:hypothetical protein